MRASMCRTLSVSLLTLGFAGCAASTPRGAAGVDAAGDGEIATRPADPDPVVAPGGPSVAVLQVRGLSCPLCAHNVDSQLRRLPGVTSAEIDLESGLVTVQLLRGKAPTPATLRHSVEEAGFTVDRVDLR